jgi:hypothetical protein
MQIYRAVRQPIPAMLVADFTERITQPHHDQGVQLDRGRAHDDAPFEQLDPMTWQVQRFVELLDRRTASVVIHRVRHLQDRREGHGSIIPCSLPSCGSHCIDYGEYR